MFLLLGLIVAIIDHEHFRLKLLYKEKKTIAAELKELKEKEEKFEVGILYIRGQILQRFQNVLTKEVVSVGLMFSGPFNDISNMSDDVTVLYICKQQYNLAYIALALNKLEIYYL